MNIQDNDNKDIQVIKLGQDDIYYVIPIFIVGYDQKSDLIFAYPSRSISIINYHEYETKGNAYSYVQ